MAAAKRVGFNIEGAVTASHSSNVPSRSFRLGMKKGSKGLMTFGRSLKSGVTRAVFPEDLKGSERKIFDPQDKSLLFWNKLLVVSCILAVYVDPIFLYLPVFKQEDMCLHMDQSLAYIVVISRTVVDAFYVVRMVLQFRTAYIAPSSRVFGRGELVIDPGQIARRYLRRYFIIDVLSVLPIPQVVVWKFLQRSINADVLSTKRQLLMLVILQYVPRFWRFVPLTSELKKTAGVFAETAWAGALYYLCWFMLISHIFGSVWYLMAVERKETCWKDVCKDSSDKCQNFYLYCGQNSRKDMDTWRNVSHTILDPVCAVQSGGGGGDDDDSGGGGSNVQQYNYGIFNQAISSGILELENFVPKYLYCLWWGLQNLSTLGQGLETSTYTIEVLFAMSVAISGLILFALLIGNMQTYLQSLTARLEEMRIKRRDSEQWMHHRVLPQELRERVRRYDQYKWLETRGVDEESLVQSLPKDLRRDIKRHLCLNLVRRVPLFANMDERLLDALCERLKPSLYTEKTYVLREGDPVDEMLFIIRGRLESSTTDGGRSGFFNRGFLKEDDFCGEELLTWALDPKAGSNLPPSTRTVKVLSEVEAFALTADEVKFITSQFRRLHSRQVQHTFRFYSQQWRTWAAIFIQAAWRRYAKRKFADYHFNEVEDEYDNYSDDDEAELIPSASTSAPSFGATMLASRFAASAMRGVHRLRSLSKVPKPPEPDFDADHAK